MCIWNFINRVFFFHQILVQIRPTDKHDYCGDCSTTSIGYMFWFVHHWEGPGFVIWNGQRKLLILIVYRILQFSTKIPYFDLQMSTCAIGYDITLLFFLFLLGSKLNSDLTNLCDTAYQSDWYRQSRSARRFVLLMMIRARQPFYLSGYGVIVLNLRNFIGVGDRNSSH